MKMTCPDCGRKAEEGTQMITHDLDCHDGLKRMAGVHVACCVPYGNCICRYPRYLAVWIGLRAEEGQEDHRIAELVAKGRAIQKEGVGR